MYLIDTDVAVHLRDGTLRYVDRIDAFRAKPALSLFTLVELEGGVAAVPSLATRRRAALDAMIANFSVIGFDQSVVAAYRDILAIRGFNRRRVLDRLIAATAIVNDLTLVTINGADFRDIPDLMIEVWPASDTDPTGQ